MGQLQILGAILEFIAAGFAGAAAYMFYPNLGAMLIAISSIFWGIVGSLSLIRRR